MSDPVRCPFCGSALIPVPHTLPNAVVVGQEDAYWKERVLRDRHDGGLCSFVVCLNCCAKGPTVVHRPDELVADAQARALEAWRTRRERRAP